MNNIPNWVLNKRKYNAERRKTLNEKGFTIELPIEKYEEINDYCKKNNITKKDLLLKIIENYKKKGEK